MQLSKIFKTFSQHFAKFVQSTSNYKHFEKKDDARSVCIFEVTHCERHRCTNVLIAACHSTLLRSTCETVQKTCEMSMTVLLWNIFLSLSETTWETSLLCIFELLQVYIKTLNADHMYSLCYISNLQVLYQIKLSKKLKILSQFFSLFLKSWSKFEHFEKNDVIHSQCISEIVDCQIYS